MNHYTNKKGYNGISARVSWRFRASQPPGDRPFGAYFTTLEPDARHLASRLGIPKEKTEYVFSFADNQDLIAVRGGRGDFIFYSPADYEVAEQRQEYVGETSSWESGEVT